MKTASLKTFYRKLKVGDYIWVITYDSHDYLKHKNRNLPVLVKAKILRKTGIDDGYFDLKLDKTFYEGIYPYNLDNCFTDEIKALSKYLDVLMKFQTEYVNNLFEVVTLHQKCTDKIIKLQTK